MPDGTVVNMPVWAFFKLDNPDMWVSNTGRFHTRYSERLHWTYPGGGCV